MNDSFILVLYCYGMLYIPLNSFLRNRRKSALPRGSLSSSPKLNVQRSTLILVGISTLYKPNMQRSHTLETNVSVTHKKLKTEAYFGMLRVQYVISSVNQVLLGRQGWRKGSCSLYVVEYLTSLQKWPKRITSLLRNVTFKTD